MRPPRVSPWIAGSLVLVFGLAGIYAANELGRLTTAQFEHILIPVGVMLVVLGSLIFALSAVPALAQSGAGGYFSYFGIAATNLGAILALGSLYVDASANDRNFRAEAFGWVLLAAGVIVLGVFLVVHHGPKAGAGSGAAGEEPEKEPTPEGKDGPGNAGANEPSAANEGGERNAGASFLVIRTLLGLGLLALGALIVVGLVEIWPVATTLSGSAHPPRQGSIRFLFGAFTLTVSSETSLLLLVILAGALGSYAFAAASFTEHLGERDFETSWTWWYLLRVPVGVALAMLVYVAFRGGFISSSSSSKNVNPYGMAALAGLAGLFSRQATARLEGAFGGSSTSDASKSGKSGDGSQQSPPTGPTTT